MTTSVAAVTGPRPSAWSGPPKSRPSVPTPARRCRRSAHRRRATRGSEPLPGDSSSRPAWVRPVVALHSSPQGTSSAVRAWRWGAERGASRPEVRTDVRESLRCLRIGVDRLPRRFRHSGFDRARRRSVESSHALVTDLQTDPKTVRSGSENARPLLVITNGSDLVPVLFPVPLNKPQKTATPLARDDRHHVTPPDNGSGARRIPLEIGTNSLGGRPPHRLDCRLDPGESTVQYLFGAVGRFLHIHFLLLPPRPSRHHRR